MVHVLHGAVGAMDIAVIRLRQGQWVLHYFHGETGVVQCRIPCPSGGFRKLERVLDWERVAMDGMVLTR
jgi:hypothetical protein